MAEEAVIRILEMVVVAHIPRDTHEQVICLYNGLIFPQTFQILSNIILLEVSMVSAGMILWSMLSMGRHRFARRTLLSCALLILDRSLSQRQLLIFVARVASSIETGPLVYMLVLGLRRRYQPMRTPSYLLLLSRTKGLSVGMIPSRSFSDASTCFSAYEPHQLKIEYTCMQCLWDWL